MKHVSLDAQNESIKQFFRGLSSDSGVSVLELDGRPIVCVLPMAGPAIERVSSDDWTDENWRCQLIDKEIAGTLSAAEAAELDGLQAEMLRHRRHIAPLPLEEAPRPSSTVVEPRSAAISARLMSVPFRYPIEPLVRKHEPVGYADYASYRPWLRDEFASRCVYCLFREQWGLLRIAFEIDHFLPVALNPADSADYRNLVYACATCNASKGTQILPDPCRFLLDGAVRVDEDGTIHPTEPETHRLVRMLGLDDPEFTEFRLLWIGIVELARTRDPDLHRRLMGFPQNLPNLHRLKPPRGNAHPEGVDDSCLSRRRRGTLPNIY